MRTCENFDEKNKHQIRKSSLDVNKYTKIKYKFIWNASILYAHIT